MPIFRGEVYYVDLGPVIGREIDGGKRRPVVVLSINDTNRKLIVTAVPGTKKANKPHQDVGKWRNVAVVPPTASNGLTHETIFQAHQIRSLDPSRFSDPPAGRLSAEHLALVEKAVRFNLGLP